MITYIDGSGLRTAADGTTEATTKGPDPRFGMQAPVTEETNTITTPGGTIGNVATSREVDQDSANPPNLITQKECRGHRGRTSTRSWNH